jgi:hypothetical protein
LLADGTLGAFVVFIPTIETFPVEVVHAEELDVVEEWFGVLLNDDERLGTNSAMVDARTITEHSLRAAGGVVVDVGFGDARNEFLNLVHDER